MDKRIEAEASGIGTLLAVYNAYYKHHDTSDHEKQCLCRASDALQDLLRPDGNRRAALALACAVLNTSFLKTHVIYSVDGSCNVFAETIINQGTREMLAAFMF